MDVYGREVWWSVRALRDGQLRQDRRQWLALALHIAPVPRDAPHDPSQGFARPASSIECASIN